MSGTVLITGGNGFLGAHFARRLALEGYRVCTFDLTGPTREALFLRAGGATSITDVTGDVTDVAALTQAIREHQVTHVVHAAAMSDPGKSVQEPYRTYALNSSGTAAVLEAVRIVGGARVVVISSNAVYDTNVYVPIDEAHPTINLASGNHFAHYGASKIVSEVMALTYSAWNDVDALVLRLSAVYGFGMRSSLYIRPMVEHAVAGRPLRLASGGAMVRDYTYSEDVAGAVLQALEAGTAKLPQRVFNISGGHAYAASELPDIVTRVLPGADIEIGDGLHAEEIRDASTRGTLDLTAASKWLGYSPAWTLLDGLTDYVRLLKAFSSVPDARAPVGS